MARAERSGGSRHQHSATAPQPTATDSATRYRLALNGGAPQRPRSTLTRLHWGIGRKALPAGERTRGLPQETSARIEAEAEARAADFGRPHFETRCGFKVQGAELAKSYHPSVPTGLDGPDSAHVHAAHPVSVVLTFENGHGVILPAIPEFVAGLTFENGNLVNVVYEPSDTSQRWHEYQGEIDKLRKLRGRIPLPLVMGLPADRRRSRPTGEANAGLQRLRSDDGALCSLRLLQHSAARSNRGNGRVSLSRLAPSLFRSRDAGGHVSPATRPTHPTGNAALSPRLGLASARGVTLPAALAKTSATCTNSLWSTFTAEGVELLTAALKSGEIKQ